METYRKILLLISRSGMCCLRSIAMTVRTVDMTECKDRSSTKSCLPLKFILRSDRDDLY
jgi:hypothetical protein